MGEIRNACKVLENLLLRRPGLRLEDNIKMDFKQAREVMCLRIRELVKVGSAS